MPNVFNVIFDNIKIFEKITSQKYWKKYNIEYNIYIFINFYMLLHDDKYKGKKCIYTTLGIVSIIIWSCNTYPFRVITNDFGEF